MEKVLSTTAPPRRVLWIIFALTFTYFVIEVVGGILTNSLALLADAAQMWTHVGGLALALFAARMSQKPTPPAKTYGYDRVEIFATLAHVVVIFLISFHILYEAYRRFQEPPPVDSLPMFTVAAVGLVVKLVGIWNLRRGVGESLKAPGAFLEVVSDTLSSLGVIVAGVIMLATGWYYADPIFSGLIGLFLLPRTVGLMTQTVTAIALRIPSGMLEGTPAPINLKAVKETIRSIPGVAEVHDLHLWTINSGMEALSAHVVLVEEADPCDVQKLLERLNTRLKEEFGIRVVAE